MTNIKYEIKELIKDIKYFLDIEKVDVDSLPGLNPVSQEREKEIQKEMSKHNTNTIKSHIIYRR